MKRTTIPMAAAAAVFASTALAQSVSKEVKARQGQFQIVAMNLGVLGNMARDNLDYDAEAAQKAANSLLGVSMIDPALLWVEGTDNGSIVGTRALPAIWENNAAFLDRWGAFAAAAAAMAEAAGGGKEAIGAAMGQIGGTCKACHDGFRAP
ncbi:MAG: cytochrome c [Rhodobacteraceae bacterium]|nr:cytochrome c [Paracoccaceae bacterium]